MKKKLTVAIVLILLLAVSLTMFVGCDEMFTRNEERDANQVVATVNYKGLSANIYKFELESSYKSYSYLYVNYYGMTAQESADYILRSLAQQKLLTLYAREKVTKLYLGENEPIPADISKLLTRSELNKAIENTNESLLNSLKSLVEDQITDDNYDNATSEDKTDEEDDEDVEVTDAVTVRFYSNGGSEVERQRIQKDTKAKKPTDPTKDGYVFYGWYTSEDCNDPDFIAGTFETVKDSEGKDKTDEAGNVIKKYVSGEFDFGTKISENTDLYARWVETTEARTEMPEVEEEEEDDYDPDNDDTSIEVLPKFFTEEYKATIEEKFAEEDFADNINPKANKTLADYINDGIAELSKNIKELTFKKTDEECYNYYLDNQMDTILVTKMQRLIGKSVTVSDAEVEAEFNAVVNKNKQTFSGSNGESAYESALSSTLTNTYYHPTLENVTGSYGFVINILLKLDDESLGKITDVCKNDPSKVGAEKALILRNRLISEMTVKVSNPSYKSSEVVKDADGEEIELRDPMTDPANPYTNYLSKDTKKDDYNKEYEVEGGNNYNKLVTFQYNKDTEEFEIVYGATEHPAMPYLLETVSAFSSGTGESRQVGIIEQIHKSLDEVKAYENAAEGPKLSKEQTVYWMREVATKWLYLVGDDSGAVTDSSNNNGLGYLVSPEGKDSNFLTDFTNYARDLIAKGTGSYYVGEIGDVDVFSGETAADGTLAGNGIAYVIADSFIGNGTTNFDSAYAGIFVLLNSYTVWDSEKADTDGHTISMDYNMTIGKDEDDIKTIKETIKSSIEEAKKTAAYNLDVNTMGVEYMESGITYYEKAYKSLWKD